MITCTRKLWFCSGHRVKGHEGKCRHLHGHNYIVYITAQADLDSIGRVIDFSILKEKFGDYIDQNFDHGFLLWDIDKEAIDAVSMIGNQKLFLLPCNPTAENIAQYLLEKSDEILETNDVQVVSIKIYETENCFAEATI
tara:strand:- start:380 stop:796 length:417 start_codon:yes stop_codon:yes gene_type:complete